MTFNAGDRVRVNGTYRHGSVGTVVLFSGGAYQVRLDGVGLRDFCPSDLLPLTANNGD